MGQLTLQLPDTLQYQLEGLAQREGVQLSQYIFYILTRQVGTTYVVQVVPSEAIAQQEIDYQNLLQRWRKDTINIPGTVEEILAKREIVEPEPELQPEIIAKLHQLIAHKSQVLKER